MNSKMGHERTAKTTAIMVEQDNTIIRIMLKEAGKPRQGSTDELEGKYKRHNFLKSPICTLAAD